MNDDREKADARLKSMMETVVFLDGSGKTIIVGAGEEEDFMLDPVKFISGALGCSEEDVVGYYKGREPWGCQRCVGTTSKGERCSKEDTRTYLNGIDHWLELRRSGWEPRCRHHRHER